MKKNYKNNSGFTLIEVIIYIALFAIVVGGGMVATYQIISGTDAGTNHVILQEEANFLLHKIDWAMTGATSFSSLPSSSLIISKSGSTFKFDLDLNKNIRLNSTILNSSSIVVSNLSFTSPDTNGVTTTFTLTTAQNGRTTTQNFSTTKYLRQ